MEGFPSVGLGLEYGNHAHKELKLPFRVKGRPATTTSKYAFNGVWFNYNRGLQDQNYKAELAFVTTNALIAGLAGNIQQMQGEQYIGIKPIIGFSYFNITVFYGYNILLSKGTREINRNNFGIVYSFRFRKTTK